MHWITRSTFLLFVSCAFTVLISANLHAEGNTVQSKLTGTWYSPDWEYGFWIEGGKGLMTSWNNTYNPDDPTKKGDVILKITKFTSDGFKGIHTFYDGSLIDVVAHILDSNTIELSGRKEVWKMYRKRDFKKTINKHTNRALVANTQRV